MLSLFKHLLPKAIAWNITIDKQLRQFFDGLVTPVIEDAVEWFDLIWLDMFPQTTRQLTQWEQQFGVFKLDLTEQERRDRLDALWAAQGAQDPRYIEDTLQAAGFDVYVHEYWEPQLFTDNDMEAVGTAAWTEINSATLSKETTDPYEGDQVMRCARNGVNDPGFKQVVTTPGNDFIHMFRVRSDGNAYPTIEQTGGLGIIWTGDDSTDWQYGYLRFEATGETQFITNTSTGTEYCEWDFLIMQPDPPVVRNPFEVLGREPYGCDDDLMECGEQIAVCGNTLDSVGYFLVNKLYNAYLNLTMLCGTANVECGEALVECGQNDGIVFERIEYDTPRRVAGPHTIDPWPGIMYIGGETFGDIAGVPFNRTEEFEDLCLKICPTHLWIGLLIDYELYLIEDESEDFLLEDESSDYLLE